MNRSTPGSSGHRSTPGSTLEYSGSPPSVPLSAALVAFTNAKFAEGLSPLTIASYTVDLGKWIERTGDRDTSSITASDVSAYLAWLRTAYQPQRLNGKDHPLSPKTIRNVYVAISSFFRWAERELSIPFPLREVRLPRMPKTAVPEFTREEVLAMIKACTYSRQATTLLRHAFIMRRPAASRDVAILLMLLDTGMRASEVCSLTIGNVDLKTGKVEIRQGPQGGAKGGKGRTVYMGRTSRRALWLYLSKREDGREPDAPLFVARGRRPLSRGTLRLMVTRMGQKAGVQKAYPHKFRHTFAITYLRSGGDVFTLQQLLGHGSLDMVRHYARIATSDVALAHRKASPVDNWRL